MFLLELASLARLFMFKPILVFLHVYYQLSIVRGFRLRFETTLLNFLFITVTAATTVYYIPGYIYLWGKKVEDEKCLFEIENLFCYFPLLLLSIADSAPEKRCTVNKQNSIYLVFYQTYSLSWFLLNRRYSPI